MTTNDANAAPIEVKAEPRVKMHLPMTHEQVKLLARLVSDALVENLRGVSDIQEGEHEALEELAALMVKAQRSFHGLDEFYD